ncbi:MAG: hypothetical protein EON85_06755 [Brevundimonas sp.]|nr:MAG: hypothetical protein EON85_06755 [Brevundimonas sp.]
MIFGQLMAAAVLIASGQAAPQTPAQTPDTSRLEDVVVQGERLADRVETFVDDINAPPVHRGPARWRREVCVGVANLRPDAAQIVVDRVSAVAVRAGLEAGEPGCSPNVLIVAAEDGDAMARGLVERSPIAFRPVYSGGARSSEQLEAFLTAPAPVRWWHVSVPVGRETGEIAVRIPGYGAPKIRGVNSRIQTATRNDLLRAFIIVDLDEAAGASFQQLGDYIGMVAMAQIDADAETGAYDTVLNLFEPGHVVDGVTDWDMSYLSALYGAELNRRLASDQAGEIASTMFRDQRRQQNETPSEP